MPSAATAAMLALCRGSLQWILVSKVHGKLSSEITRLRLVPRSWVGSSAVRFLFVSCRPLGSSWQVGKWSFESGFGRCDEQHICQAGPGSEKEAWKKICG